MVIDSVVQSISQNWVVILITALITIIAAVFSNWGIKRRLRSAKQKDKQTALEELHRIIEDLVVTNRDQLTESDPDLDDLGLSSRRIEDLIEASERKHNVFLSDSTTPEALLQDVDLRIKDSRHLDSKQINQYSECITNIIGEVRREDERDLKLYEEGEDLLERIEEKAKYEDVEDDLDRVRKSIAVHESDVSSTTTDRQRRVAVLVVSVIAASMSLLAFFLESIIRSEPFITILVLVPLLLGLKAVNS